MLDPEYREALRERIVTRARAEWPGVHQFPARGKILIGPVEDGGATASLIDMVADIAIEELTK